MLERALERTVGGLDVAVLLLGADLGRAWRHAEVTHEREVVFVERALAAALPDEALAVRDPMRRGGGVIGLVPGGHAPELEEGALHPLSDGSDRFGQADRRPSPIGVGQDDHAKHVDKELSGDRHRELGRPREVGLRSLARSVLLREHDLLVRPALGAPGLHPPLQGAQLPLVVASRVRFSQDLEERLGFERRGLGQPRFELGPVFDERILVRPPVARLRPLGRQLAVSYVRPCGLAVHAGSHRGEADAAVLRHLFHQLPHLRVRRPHRRRVPLSGAPAAVDQRASGWGDVTVVHGEM